MPSAYTEDHLVEQPAIQLLEHELGWDSAMAFGEWESGRSDLGREAKREVVLISRLKPALQSLNPTLPAEALEAAMDELTRDRSALSLVEANREDDKRLRGGVKVPTPVRLADFSLIARFSPFGEIWIFVKSARNFHYSVRFHHPVE